MAKDVRLVHFYIQKQFRRSALDCKNTFCVNQLQAVVDMRNREHYTPSKCIKLGHLSYFMLTT